MPDTVETADVKPIDLVVESVDVDLIDPAPWNPNKQNELVAKATRESLQLFGFVEPLLLRPHPESPGRYQFVGGEHRWIEARALGYTHVPAVVRDLDDEAAKKLMIVLNETTGEADVVLLGQLLAQLQEGDDFRTALPYTDAELEHLLSIGREDWDRFNAGGDGDDDATKPPPVEFEIVLTFTSKKKHDAVRKHLSILEKEWGTSAVSDLVAEAVKRSALAANQGVT